MKGCCRWGGINDKGMACSRRYMQAMLRAPHEELLWNISSPSIGRTNNENFIADHMRNHGVPVQEVCGTPADCNGQATLLLQIGEQ